MPAEERCEDQSRPSGFPLQFGEGPEEDDAVLLLRCLLGITPRSLHALVWREGSASSALAAIAAGSAGSDNDRTWLEQRSAASVRAELANAGAR